jgi:hypothetical protein
MAASLMAAVPADAQRVYTTVRVGDPYTGAVLDFDTAPRMALIPNTQVYYVNDRDFNGDLYRVGNYWYYADDGSWYRASSWRGPFLNIRESNVPVDVMQVPDRYRMSWSAGTDRRYDQNNRRYDQNNGRYDQNNRRYDRNTQQSVRVGDYYSGTAVQFRVQPPMRRIQGSSVYYIRSNFDNDLYRFGSRWYLVEDGVWYSAPSWRGQFRAIRFRDAPASVRNVPMSYRRSWQMASTGRTYRTYEPTTGSGTAYRGSGSFHVGLNNEPNMSIIPGTRVLYLRDESDVDLYRYGNNWYMVDAGVWYRANSWSGPFYRATMSSVPGEVLEIPSGYRKTWTY